MILQERCQLWGLTMIEKYKHLKIRILKETYQYVLLKQHSSLGELNLLLLNSKKPVALFISDEEKSFIAPSDLEDKSLVGVKIKVSSHRLRSFYRP